MQLVPRLAQHIMAQRDVRPTCYLRVIVRARWSAPSGLPQPYGRASSALLMIVRIKAPFSTTESQKQKIFYFVFISSGKAKILQSKVA